MFAVLSVIFDLPEKETLLGHVVNIQLLATIVSIIGFGVFGAWLFLRIYLFYPTKTMKYEVYITGDVSRIIPEIKIENKEPVKIQDIYVEMIRFSWNKQVWNDINKFTVGDRFFSVGLSDDRSAFAKARARTTHIAESRAECVPCSRCPNRVAGDRATLAVLRPEVPPQAAAQPADPRWHS